MRSAHDIFRLAGSAAFYMDESTVCHRARTLAPNEVIATMATTMTRPSTRAYSMTSPPRSSPRSDWRNITIRRRIRGPSQARGNAPLGELPLLIHADDDGQRARMGCALACVRAAHAVAARTYIELFRLCQRASTL